jgi:hypothetical protein
MAATTGYHECLEWFFAVVVGQGCKRGYQNKSK